MNREQFEQWASDDGKFPLAVERAGDSYRLLATQNNWATWQAATASSTKPLGEVKIYSASPSDMSPPVDDASFCVDFVLASDYAALQAERDLLAAECARYSMSAGHADQRMAESRAVRSALGFNPEAEDVSPSDLVESINQIVAELCVIRSAHPQPLGAEMDAAIDAFNAEEMPETGMLNAFFILRDSIRVETPATDRFLAEQRAVGVDIARNTLITFVEDEVGPNENVPGLIRGAEVCESIAAQLRNEVKG